MFIGDFILKQKSVQDIARFLAMVFARLDLGPTKVLQILLGYVEPILIEFARFASITLIPLAYFKTK